MNVFSLARRIQFAENLFERDTLVAKQSAHAWVIAQARAEAPFSYAELRAALKGPGGSADAVKALLATVPADLIRLQAIRFCAERFEAHPEHGWDFGTVDAVEARFRAYAAEGIQAAQRRAAADAAEAEALAPHSYADLAEAEREGTLAFVLSELPAHLLQAQAVRWLVGRKAATGEAWVWADVAATAHRFAAMGRGWRRCLRAALEAEAEAEADTQTALDVRDEAADADADGLAGRMLAELARLEAEASAAADAAKADDDAELARIARRSARACRDAAGLVASGAGWFEGGAGTLLVASRSKPGSYQRVGRDERGRVTCTCPWHEREGARLGPCVHQAVFDAWERVR